MPEIARLRGGAGCVSVTRNVSSSRVSYPIGRSALEDWMALYNTMQKNFESRQPFK